MHLFCFLCVLFATPWSLGKCFGQTNSGLCSSSGELPAPNFFLNGTLIQEGDWVTLRCMHASDLSVGHFFFCQDGRLLSQTKAMFQDGVHTLSIKVSQHSGGQYSCGYEQLDKDGQKKKSALSSSRSLSVMTGHIDQSRWKEASCPVQNRPIVVGIVAFTILFLVSLLFYLVKKDAFHHRSLREEDVVKAISDKPSDELQYSEIVRFSTDLPPLSENTEEIYVTMTGKKPNHNVIPVLEIPDVSNEDVLE